MIALKKHIVYALLVCYVCTVASGLYIIVSGSEVTGAAVLGIFSAAVVQTAAIIVAFVKSPEYFTEPEAITKLEKEHLKAVSEIQDQLTKSMQDRENMISWIGTKIMPDDSAHPFYHWIKKRKEELDDNPESTLEPQESKRSTSVL